VDPLSRKRWLFDATPDLPAQLHQWKPAVSPQSIVSGIFLTHGHIGHYAGLMHLGREVIGAIGIDAFAMPRMQTFLETNGPWSQLVKLRNIVIVPIVDHQPIKLTETISVTPLLVPHRDEYTETVGFSIAGKAKRVLYLPDIDKWEKWSSSIEDVIAAHDVVFIDGTFFGEGELAHRTMAEVPHPFISESMTRFAKLSAGQRAKIRFIHLNHGNPALDPQSHEAAQIRAQGFAVAVQGDAISL
jgi:pyrroloquinoline quinone biosynthesis protein B